MSFGARFPREHIHVHDDDDDDDAKSNVCV